MLLSADRNLAPGANKITEAIEAKEKRKIPEKEITEAGEAKEITPKYH